MNTKHLDQSLSLSERISGKGTATKALIALIALLLCFATFAPHKQGNAEMVPDSIQIIASNMSKDLRCMAKVIYDEARGEPHSGKVAVGAVIMNRVKSKNYPDNVCHVAFQKWGNVCQFSGMCKKDVKEFDETSLRIAYNILIKGDYKDPTKGATHFHNETASPNWSNMYAKTVKIGNHIFYKQSYRKNQRG